MNNDNFCTSSVCVEVVKVVGVVEAGRKYLYSSAYQPAVGLCSARSGEGGR